MRGTNEPLKHSRYIIYTLHACNLLNKQVQRVNEKHTLRGSHRPRLFRHSSIRDIIIDVFGNPWRLRITYSVNLSKRKLLIPGRIIRGSGRRKSIVDDSPGNFVGRTSRWNLRIIQPRRRRRRRGACRRATRRRFLSAQYTDCYRK